VVFSETWFVLERYFGDRGREFEALLAKSGVDWAGPFETYNHATPLALACGRGHLSVVKANMKNVLFFDFY
jgi:hypothetical protein